MDEDRETILVDSSAESTHSDSGIMSPEITLVVLTWVTFFLLLAVLKKFAWGPILSGLDAREESIRKSIEDAERIQQEMAKMDETRNKILDDAKTSAKEILDQSRAASKEEARIIHNKAKEETKILAENAQREIREELERARVQLRTESAQIAIDLAGKILEKNLNTDANRKLANRFIKEI